MPAKQTAAEQSKGAEILPFRRSAPAAEAQVAVPADPNVRLAEAIASLRAALEKQKEAVALWRLSLQDLKAGVAKIGGNLEKFQGSLAGIQGDVGKLNGQAKQLAAWADSVAAREGKPIV